MSPGLGSADAARSRAHLERDLARLALYLREAGRAARRLGFTEVYNVTLPSLLQLRGMSAGVDTVPALELQETELPERLPLRELVQEVTAELFRD